MKYNFGISILSVASMAKLDSQQADILQSFLQVIKILTAAAHSLNLKAIELSSVSPFDSPVLVMAKDKIRTLVDNLLCTFHLPLGDFNIGALNQGIREVSMEEMKQLIEFSKSIGISTIVSHPGHFQSDSRMYKMFEPLAKKYVYEGILNLNEFSKERGVTLAVENLNIEEPFFHTPVEFEPLCENGVNLTLDTAHAIIAGVNPTDFLQKFPNQIAEIHLVDGKKGKLDLHYALGDGELDVKSFFQALKNTNFNGPIILEMATIDDVKKSLLVLKNLKLI